MTHSTQREKKTITYIEYVLIRSHAHSNKEEGRGCIWMYTYSKHRNKSFTKGTGGIGSLRPSEDHPNYCIIENGQNTEKNPGDEETCCHSSSSERPSANADVKNYYYYYYCYHLLLESFHISLADGLSLEFEWQQVSSSPGLFSIFWLFSIVL